MPVRDISRMRPFGPKSEYVNVIIEATKGGDGDPMDVLVLTDEPTFVGCLIHAKLLGVIEAEQTENGETVRNDRLVAIPIGAKSGKPAEGAIKQLQPRL